MSMLSFIFLLSVTPHLDRYAEGVDIGHIVSTPSALYYLTKTGIENGKLLFTSNSEHLAVADTISSPTIGIAPSKFISLPSTHTLSCITSSASLLSSKVKCPRFVPVGVGNWRISFNTASRHGV